MAKHAVLISQQLLLVELAGGVDTKNEQQGADTAGDNEGEDPVRKGSGKGVCRTGDVEMTVLAVL